MVFRGFRDASLHLDMITQQQRIRLLDLFPVEALKNAFALDGPKEAVLIAAAVACPRLLIHSL